ncbi:hypothetical protein K439DRAFT_1640487 [Ramaria rubella]|nr:hypothetical protein K439DRAFT_1640487 [Ramaria rubella]
MTCNLRKESESVSMTRKNVIFGALGPPSIRQETKLKLHQINQRISGLGRFTMAFVIVPPWYGTVFIET